MNKKVLIIISFILLIVVGIIAFCLWYSNPRVAFQRKFHFRLPNSAEILNESYSFYYDSLDLKVNFDSEDLKEIQEKIKDYAVNYGLREVKIKNDTTMFNFSVCCHWWDEEKEKVILAYEAYKQGRWGAKTRIICVLITQDSQGKYFLHIRY